jgi:hypothetical protein
MIGGKLTIFPGGLQLFSNEPRERGAVLVSASKQA